MATDTAHDNQLAQELQAQRKELQDHLDIVQELVVKLDQQGNVVSINRKGCKILGRSRAQILGQNWFDTVIPAADRPGLKKIQADMLAGRHSKSSQRENDIVTKTGERRRIHFRDTCIRDSDGHITGTLSSGIDVTETRLQGRKVAALQRGLSQAAGFGVLGEVAAGLAHEINQPLSAISTYTDACLRILDNDDPNLAQLRHALNQVNQQSRRAGDVVAQMRSFTAQPQPDAVLVGCNALIRDLMDIITDEAHNHQVSATLDLEEPLQEVSVDPVQIQRVILNFFANAIDALQTIPARDRKVAIQTRRDGDKIRCSVIDNGPGVAESTVPKLFDPFFTTKEAGIGLGLSICQTIIRHNGGRVDYQPNPGNGAIFSFTLPIPPQHDPGSITT